MARKLLPEFFTPEEVVRYLLMCIPPKPDKTEDPRADMEDASAFRYVHMKRNYSEQQKFC